MTPSRFDLAEGGPRLVSKRNRHSINSDFPTRVSHIQNEDFQCKDSVNLNSSVAEMSGVRSFFPRPIYRQRERCRSQTVVFESFCRDPGLLYCRQRYPPFPLSSEMSLAMYVNNCSATCDIPITHNNTYQQSAVCKYQHQTKPIVILTPSPPQS